MSLVGPQALVVVALALVSAVPVLALDHHSGHDNDSAIQRWSSLIGIITAIVGNVLISFALNIQRYAHIRLSRENSKTHDLREDDSGSRTKRTTVDTARNGNTNHHLDSRDANDYDGAFSDHTSEAGSESTIRNADDATQKTYLKSPYWWAGICLMTIGEAGNFLAYGFAPASIVSPLGVVALVSNCVIAPFMLKETFRPQDFWGVLVAIAGAVTVVSSAKQSETKLGQHEIWDAISRWEFILYMVITVSMILALVWASSHKYGQRTSLVDLGLVALFGAYTALSTKGVASLLSYTFWRVLTFPIFYLLLAILVSTAMLQIRYLNKALQRFDSTQVIPTQFVLFTISVIIGSAVLYRDFESATLDRVIKFIAGCLLTFVGVYLITSGREPDDDYEDEEEAIGLEQDEYVDTVHGEAEGETSALLKTQFSDYGTSIPRTPHRELSNQSDPLPSPLHDFSSAEASPRQRPRLSDDPDSSRSRHALQPTTSSPVLPSEAQDTDVRPSAGRAATQHPSPATPNRPSTLGRRSMSRMLPGPLFSPLSSSLSAVVADSLRRGYDVSQTRELGGSIRDAVRQPRLSLRPSRSLRFTDSTASHDNDQASGEPSRRGSDNGDSFDRRKSFGASIGEFFRRKRGSDQSET